MNKTARDFGNKIRNISKHENLTISQMAKLCDIPYNRLHDYQRLNCPGNPAYINIVKIIQVFPQYTCYILDLNPQDFPKQIIID